MALNFGTDFGFKFQQSDKAGIGINKRGRIETATIIVSKDGSGDFEDIQEAIDSLPNGGYIQIKEGNYIIKTSISVGANITIQGVGQNSKLKADGITNIMTITGEKTKIKDLSFEGENTSDDGIIINAVTNITIQDCFFNTFNKGVESSGTYCLIIGNKFENCSKGIYLKSGVLANVIGNLFDYDAGGTTMIESGGITYSSITGNCGFGSEGWQGNGSDYKVQITGNNFSENGNCLINGYGCLFVGNISNTITNSGTASIIANNG